MTFQASTEGPEPHIEPSGEPAENRPRRGRRGLKPGQKHSGSFKAGFDERRFVPSEARVKIRKTVEELCKQHAEDAVAYLAGLVNDPNAPEKERRAASSELLDRAFGRPVDRVAIANVGVNHGSDVTQLSNEELLRLAEKTALTAPPDAPHEEITLEGEVLQRIDDPCTEDSDA